MLRATFNTSAILVMDTPSPRILFACRFFAAVSEDGRPPTLPRSRAADSPAEHLGVSRPTAIFWRARYRQRGLPGLVDAPKSGRPQIVEPRSIISAMVNEPPRKYGAQQWTSRLLAQHLQIGKTAVQAAWREYGIAPDRRDGFTFATVPAFTATITTIVGLHLGTHTNAVALAVAPRSCRREWTIGARTRINRPGNVNGR